MIEPSTSSQRGADLVRELACRRMPAGLRSTTVTTRRISSWVLRSGAWSESICRHPGVLRFVQRGEHLVERLLEREVEMSRVT